MLARDAEVDQEHAGKITFGFSGFRPGNTSASSTSALVEVARERAVWASLLKLLPWQPRSLLSRMCYS